MTLVRSAKEAKYGFFLANLLLIYIMYHRFESMGAFLFCAGGLLVISWSIRRVIYKLTGN